MSDKIVVYRTHIEINNYDRWDCPPIEKLFSIFNMTYHRYEDKGLIYNPDRRVLMLPRGMNISYLEQLFQEQAYFDQSVDPYYDIGKIMLKKTPRDEIQEKAIQFMLDTLDYNMSSLNLNTGKGKTYCGIATIAYLHLRSIIIASSTDWLSQWKNFVLDYTNIDESEIYFISGSPSILKLYNRDTTKYKILLCTHSTIQSYGTTYGWNKIAEFFNYMQIGVKIFDEAHLNFDNMFAIDCYSNSFMTYYLTATPARSDYKENNIYSIYFKNVPSIDLYDHSKDAHTEYVAIKYTSNPTAQQISNCKGRYGLDRMKYIDYLIHQDNFYYLLMLLIERAIAKPGKTLFYIGTNEAILVIRDWIYNFYPELVGNVGIYTSIIPIERKVQELEKKIILTTTKSAGLAVDIKGLVDTINLAEPFKSKVLAQQTFGRTRDYDTMYKDCVDTGFYYTRKFYDFKKPVFAKYATRCREVFMDNNELIERGMNIIKERENIIQPIIFDDDR